MTNSYRIRSIAELSTEGLPFEEMFSQFDKVYEAQSELTELHNNLGDNEKWNRLMRHSPSSIFALSHEDRIVGFWSLFPITDHLYEIGIKGGNINASIGINDIDEFTLPGDYSLYFVDLYILREHRWHANTLMFRSFTSFLKRSARKGYFTKRIFAHAASYYSIKLCERLGFNARVDHLEHKMRSDTGEIIPTKIYELIIESDERSNLFKLDKELYELYHKHYQGSSHELPHDDDEVGKLIAAGESQKLEFKHSLRFDASTSSPNKKLEDVVIKTIAGFANQDGGTLLIGVCDDGRVSGIESDYTTLTGGNRDKFELHIANLANARFGAAFTARHLRFSFPKLSGKVLCRIEISPSSSPVIVKLADSSGNLTERFFVRSGASTQELSPSQIAAFLSSRIGEHGAPTRVN